MLREIQQKTLHGAVPPISWTTEFEGVPPGPAFIVANEFFDALPVRHFVKTEAGWRERLVGVDNNGALAFGLSGTVEHALKIDAPPGSVIEVAAAAQALMAQMARRIVDDGGAMLIVDYGYTQTTLGESLQALKDHAYVDPLHEPGEADLTTHVDFAALARAARAEARKSPRAGHSGGFPAPIGRRTAGRGSVAKCVPRATSRYIAAVRVAPTGGYSKPRWANCSRFWP